MCDIIVFIKGDVMEFIERIMSRCAVPEFAEVVSDINKLFEKHGYEDHVLDYEYLEGIESTVENQFLVDSVMGLTARHGRNLLLKMFIVVDKDLNIFLIRDILEVLDSIENSVESESIIHLVNEELEPKDQLLEWVNLLVSEKADLISEHILDVRTNIIENIVSMHELRVPLETEEVDSVIKTKITQLKNLRNILVKSSCIAIERVKEKGFKKYLSEEDILNEYTEFFNDNANELIKVSQELIGLSILMEGDPKETTLTAKRLAESFYKDPMYVIKVHDAITGFMNGKNELC